MSELTFEKIKERFDFHVQRYTYGHASVQVTPGLKGACIGILESYAGGQMGRYAITEALTGARSSTDLYEGHWYALYMMVDPHKDQELEQAGEPCWIGRENLAEIVQVILDHIGPIEQQLPLLGEETDIPWDDLIEEMGSTGSIPGDIGYNPLDG